MVKYIGIDFNFISSFGGGRATNLKEIMKNKNDAHSRSVQCVLCICVLDIFSTATTKQK